MSLHRVVGLVGSVQSPFELGCAAEVFGGVQSGVRPRYRFALCAERPGPVQTSVGYAMLVEAGLEALREADTVVVPGWLPHGMPVPAAVAEALREAHRRGTRTTGADRSAGRVHRRQGRTRLGGKPAPTVPSASGHHARRLPTDLQRNLTGRSTPAPTS